MRLRADALLGRALAALEAGHLADALVATETVCRQLPHSMVPALLRSRILQAAGPDLACRAWFHAWTAHPLDASVQDGLLRAWLAAGRQTEAASLGLAFLPERCREQTQGSLVALLQSAGVAGAGACWKEAGQMAAAIFDPAARVRLLVTDGVMRHEYDVPGGGQRFRLPFPSPHGAWSLAWSAAPGAPPRLMQGSPLVLTNPPPRGRIAAPASAPRPLSIVIPVYRGLAQVQACIESVLASLPVNRSKASIVVIDDASPEPAVSRWLDRQAASGRLTLLRNDFNLGFIETVNRGMRHHPEHDVLLLNADTLVHGDWIDRLRSALYARDDTASVSPWSNNGEISSFPVLAEAAPTPDAAQLALIDKTAARLHRQGAVTDVELPSCCGFAMLIRRSVLDAIGLLDGAQLIRGYSEEVDWCQRARTAGYRHLAATGVFVAHAGSVSFGHEKTLRVRQNRAVIAARYPDYYPAYADFLARDPLGPARRTLATALEVAGTTWPTPPESTEGNCPAAAMPGSKPRAPLRSACQRIALWQHKAGTPTGAAMLALARLVASRAPSLPPLRLLVLGEPTEALWRTGVVDALAAAAPDASLLDDADLLALSACSIVLGAGNMPLVPGVEQVSMGANFDPASWLSDFEGRAQRARSDSRR